MSLTSELKYNLELKNLIESSLKIKKEKLLNNQNILYPLIGDFKESGIVGTAYDYLLRIFLVREKKLNYKLVMYNFIASKAFFYLYSQNKIKLIEKPFEEAYKIIESFFERKAVTKKELLVSIIYLSFMDQVYRNNNLEYINNVKELYAIKEMYANIYNDLKNLLETLNNLDKVFFDKNLLTNPSFKNSSLIGGADADLIINNTLIEIKTVKNPEVNTDILSQLIGYVVLASFDNIKINKIGVYFSRFNELKIYKIEDIIEEKDLWKIKKYLNKKYKMK